MLKTAKTFLAAFKQADDRKPDREGRPEDDPRSDTS
jgi:hypothetical protein